MFKPNQQSFTVAVFIVSIERERKRERERERERANEFHVAYLVDWKSIIPFIPLTVKTVKCFMKTMEMKVWY